MSWPSRPHLQPPSTLCPFLGEPEDRSVVETKDVEVRGPSDGAYRVPNSTCSVVENVVVSVGRCVSLKIEPRI